MDDVARYWGSIRNRTMKVAELVPNEQIDWSPGAGVMSFGDLLRHLALVERWMFIETAMGRPSRYRSHGMEFGATMPEVLALMKNSHAESIALLNGLTAEDLLSRIVTPAGASITVSKWLRAMVEHEVHHRGQLYLMLRLIGIATPPIFGLTSEELRRTASDVAS